MLHDVQRSGVLWVVFFREVAILPESRPLADRKERRLEMAIKIGELSDTHFHGVTPVPRRIHDLHLLEPCVLLHAGDVVSTGVVRFRPRGVQV